MPSSATLPLSFGIEPGRSWLELLASSALGVERVEQVEVEVVARTVPDGPGPFRLVVQTYAKQFGRKQRPLGSTQRAVSAAELRQGVRLSLVELGGSEAREPYVVAWIEVGDPLEMDARHAHPPQGHTVAVGRALRGTNPVRLVLG